MFRTFIASVVSCLAILCSAGNAWSAVELTPQSHIVIVTKGPVAKDLSLAADLLEKYLPLALKRDGLQGSGQTVTFELQARGLAWASLPVADRPGIHEIDAYTIEVIDKPHAVIRIEGATVLAVSYGVMHVLQEQMGITWLFPGELGLVLPEQTHFTWPAEKLEIKPAVVSRLYTGMRYADPDAMLAFRRRYRDTPLYMQRIFFEGHDYFKSLKLNNVLAPSHNMINIFPVEQTIRDMPEVLPLDDQGQRYIPPLPDGTTHRHQNWHPCYTNAKTVETAVKQARAAFEGGALCFSLGINDGHRQQCQCVTCRSLGWPQSYYHFVTQVADAVRKDYPSHLIGVLVYGDVRYPADDLKLPDNVMVLVSGGSKLSKWSNHAQYLGRYTYAYGVGFAVPTFPLKAMRHNARVFAERGVISFRAEVHPVWAFDGPKVYILSRMLWDLKADPDALLTRYCQAAFGEGGPAMKAFYLHWASQADELVKEDDQLELAPFCNMAQWRNASAQFSKMEPSDWATPAAMLQEAAKKAATESQQQRVAMVRTQFDLSRTEFELYHDAQQVFAGKKLDSEALRNLFDSVAHKQARRLELLDRIEQHPEWTMAGGRTERVPEWSIEKDVHTALITTILDMRARGLPSEAMVRILPPRYAPYVQTPFEELPVSGRLKVMDRGIYYAQPAYAYLFSPMQVSSTSDGVIDAIASEPNVLIESGSNAGRYKQHWAFALMSFKQVNARRMYRVEIETEANDGVLDVKFTQPWPTDQSDTDGLPVGTTLVFDGKSTRKTRSMVIEPLTPDAPRFNDAASWRISLLWTPADEDAHCKVSLRFTEILTAASP